MKGFFARVLLHLFVLLGCLAATGVLSLLVPFPTWVPTGLALWFLFSLGALCAPDEAWERLFSRR